jgi:DNA primase large subunit
LLHLFVYSHPASVLFPFVSSSQLTRCQNRVFDFVHKQEIKKVRDEGTWGAAQLETIVHPNEYFKRSYLLKNMGKNPGDAEEEKGDVKMED